MPPQPPQTRPVRPNRGPDEGLTDLHLQNAVTAVLAVRQILDGGAGPLGPKPTARRLLDEGRY